MGRGRTSIARAGGPARWLPLFIFVPYVVLALRIGPEIDPGVPWTYAEPTGLHLALKSGNFGARDFFLKAFGV